MAHNEDSLIETINLKVNKDINELLEIEKRCLWEYSSFANDVDAF